MSILRPHSGRAPRFFCVLSNFLFHFMDTLLTKVTALEDEAKRLVEVAQQEGEQALAALLARESEALRDTRAQAQARGEQIVKEMVDRAKGEIMSMHQEEAGVVAALAERAQSNRAAVVSFVVDTLA